MVAANDFAGTLASVKSSCLASIQHSQIQISDSGIDKYLEHLEETDYDKYILEHGYRFPLNFSSMPEELNFLSLVSLLNFLSGYRLPLHEKTSRGAFDTIRHFMLSAFLSGEGLLSAKGLAELSEYKCAELLGIPLMIEKSHATLPIQLSERDPVAVEIVDLVKGVCNRTGAILKKSGHADMGSWLIKKLEEGKDLDEAARSDHLLHALVSTFPDFRDEGQVGEHPVYLYKKALLVLHITATAFADRNPPFPLPPACALPVFCDNVLPTMANNFGFLDLSDSVYPKFRNGLGESTDSAHTAGLEVTSEEAYAIRAATLAACERAVSRAQKMSSEKEQKGWLKKMNAIDLDGYLWAKAKDGELRKIPRLSETRTTFY